jgi:hypothetical protein
LRPQPATYAQGRKRLVLGPGARSAARPSQAIRAIRPPHTESQMAPAKTGKLIALPVLGAVAHDYRSAV